MAAKTFLALQWVRLLMTVPTLTISVSAYLFLLYLMRLAVILLRADETLRLSDVAIAFQHFLYFSPLLDVQCALARLSEAKERKTSLRFAYDYETHLAAYAPPQAKFN
jgi:hypothetical protein